VAAFCNRAGASYFQLRLFQLQALLNGNRFITELLLCYSKEMVEQILIFNNDNSYVASQIFFYMWKVQFLPKKKKKDVFFHSQHPQSNTHPH